MCGFKIMFLMCGLKIVILMSVSPFRKSRKNLGLDFRESRDRDFEKILGCPGIPLGPARQTFDTLVTGMSWTAKNQKVLWLLSISLYTQFVLKILSLIYTFWYLWPFQPAKKISRRSELSSIAIHLGCIAALSDQLVATLSKTSLHHLHHLVHLTIMLLQDISREDNYLKEISTMSESSPEGSVQFS